MVDEDYDENTSFITNGPRIYTDRLVGFGMVHTKTSHPSTRLANFVSRSLIVEELGWRQTISNE